MREETVDRQIDTDRLDERRPKPARLRPLVRWAVAVMVVVHGLIHLFGASKGLGWSDVSQLKEPIGTAAGAVWLVAAVLTVGAGVMLAASIRGWWIVGVVAATISQAVIATSWSDAKAGTIANVVVLGAAVYGAAANGPTSFSAEYRRRVATALTRKVGSPTVTEDDLTALPTPVAAYLRGSGAVGQPRINNFRADIHGRIRGGPNKPWMAFTGEQVNTFGANPSRSFRMDATMFGLPVDVLHIFADATATMRVKACSLFPMVNASGPEMDRAETVTVFNDLCVLAPAAIIDAPITWHSGHDDHQAHGTFTNRTHTVTAELTFNDEHELVDFVSDDRMGMFDGRTFSPRRWSTPISAYRTIRSRRVATFGEGRWHAPAPDGEYTYLEFNLDDIVYNVASTGKDSHSR